MGCEERSGLAQRGRKPYKARMSHENRPVLAFDTSLNGCAICARSGDKNAVRLFPTEREQAAKLVPLINETLEEAGITYKDLGLIVTTVGPGSFTGLRIGLSTARALGLALNIPVQGVSTLTAMAATCHKSGDKNRSLVILETKRSDFYIQSFLPDLHPLGEASCAPLDDILSRDLNETIFCGDGAERFMEEALLAGRHFEHPDLRTRLLLDPAILLTLGENLFKAADFRAEKPVPVYLRGADVSNPKKPAREIQDSPI